MSKREEIQLLRAKINSANSDINTNIGLGVVAIIVLLFVPLVTFENFQFRFSLEVIIAFVALIVALVRGPILRSKKTELEEELRIKGGGGWACAVCDAEITRYDDVCPHCNNPISSKHRKQGNEPAEAYVETYECSCCHSNFKSEASPEKHTKVCDARIQRQKRLDTWTFWAFWGLCACAVLLTSIVQDKYRMLLPAGLILFLITPWFDTTVNWIFRRGLPPMRFVWWKKGIGVIVVVLVFAIISFVPTYCPVSCEGQNSCYSGSCGLSTGYQCVQTAKTLCAGNGVCEVGEYGTSDCPNCDDANKCTADTYDVGAQSCLHVPIRGCQS